MDQDSELYKKLNERDKDLGLGGDFRIIIENQLTKDVLVIHSLTQSASRRLFDQIDESNKCNQKFKISLARGNVTVDYNILPNAFTEPV